MIDQQTFRESTSRLGAAVTVIATTGPAGQHGFTASAVCSVMDKPPTLLVCMNRDFSSHASFLVNRVLSVNVLTGAYETLSNGFADRSLMMADRFATATWLTGVTGAPLLKQALVAFNCSIVQVSEVGTHSQVSEVGTHSVLFCKIKQIFLGQMAPHALM